MNKKLLAIGVLVGALVVGVFAVSSGKFELGSDHGHDHAHEATVFIDERTSGQVSVVFAGDHIDFTGLGYEDLMLTQVPAASGARFENVSAGLAVWNKGDEVTVYRNDEVLFAGHEMEHSHDHGDEHGGVTGEEAHHEEEHHHEPKETATSSADTPALTTQPWVWEKYISPAGTVVAPNRSGAFTLAFAADGTVAGGTDCNSFGGSYKLEGSKLEFDALASTKMYCEGSQETEYLGYLTSDHHTITMSGTELILKQADGGELHFVAQ